MITPITNGLMYISTMTMSFNATNKVYTLDRIDTDELEKFVAERNV